MLKKLSVLAMALGAVAAMVFPAAASAEWKHHNTPITESKTIGVTGNVRFQGGLGGVECQVTSRVRFDPGTTGVAETFVPHPTDDTTNCKGLGGLGPCQVHNVAPQAPNWTIHTVRQETKQVTNPGQAEEKTHQTFHDFITVTTTNITSQTTGGLFCLVKAINLTGGTTTFTPTQPNTIPSATLSGQLQAHLQTNGGATDQETVTVSGTLNVESPDANTYSI